MFHTKVQLILCSKTILPQFDKRSMRTRETVMILKALMNLQCFNDKTQDVPGPSIRLKMWNYTSLLANIRKMFMTYLKEAML